MAELKKRAYDELHFQKRGWGGEFWVENIPEYCGKVLHIDAGKRGSLHFHMKKLETMMLVSGTVDLLMVDPDLGREYTVRLDKEGDSILIPRGQVHQIIALEESVVVEFSTTHEESDSYRVRKGD